MPWSLVRATQFHELIAATLAPAARWRVLPVPRAALQPVACAEVADARDLARTWRSVTGRRAILLPVPLPGKLGRALRAGALTAGRPDVSGTIRFAAWLESAQREAALQDAAREDARPEAARR